MYDLTKSLFQGKLTAVFMIMSDVCMRIQKIYNYVKSVPYRVLEKVARFAEDNRPVQKSNISDYSPKHPAFPQKPRYGGWW